MKTFHCLCPGGIEKDQYQALKLFQDFHNRSRSRGELPTFLERLKEALAKHTSQCPNSIWGQAILKDKFITRSAPVIRKKKKTSKTAYKCTLANLLKDILQSFTAGSQRTLNSKRKKDTDCNCGSSLTTTSTWGSPGVSGQGEHIESTSTFPQKMSSAREITEVLTAPGHQHHWVQVCRSDDTTGLTGL